MHLSREQHPGLHLSTTNRVVQIESLDRIYNFYSNCKLSGVFMRIAADSERMQSRRSGPRHRDAGPRPRSRGLMYWTVREEHRRRVDLGGHLVRVFETQASSLLIGPMDMWIIKNSSCCLYAHASPLRRTIILSDPVVSTHNDKVKVASSHVHCSEEGCADCVCTDRRRLANTCEGIKSDRKWYLFNLIMIRLCLIGTPEVLCDSQKQITSRDHII